MTTDLSRRSLVRLVGRAGGAIAVRNTLGAMGLLAPATACSDVQLAQGSGNGVRVVIHGSEFPDTPPERSAELRAIVESMRIDD